MTEANPPEGKSTWFRYFSGGVIILMIVLMLYAGNSGARQQLRAQHGLLVGTSNIGDVMSQDSRYATNLLDQLSRVTVIVPPLRRGDQPQYVPLLNGAWGELIIRDMKAHPEALYLALREARRISPGVNPYTIGSPDAEQQNGGPGIFNSAEVNLEDLRVLPTSPLGLLRRQLSRDIPVQVAIASRIDDRRTEQVSPNTLPPLEQQSVYAALQDFLTIQSAASLPLNALKPTTPMIDKFVAEALQSFSLQLATVDVVPFIPKVPAPTDDQLSAQLSKYAALEPDRWTASNPFGFGYRVADRVKLEVVSFKRADVRQVVAAEKTPYDWDVAARMAYAKDPTLAVPTTQPSTQPAAGVQAPYDTVKDQVIAAVIDRITDTRCTEVEKAIRAPMMLDYQQWANATTTRPGVTPPPTGSAPKSSLGESYNSLNYLTKLSEQVHAKFKVQPIVDNYTDQFRDLTALEQIAGFGQASRPVPPNLFQFAGQRHDTLNGPEYAVQCAKDLLSADGVERLGALVLERYRPSERLELDHGKVGEQVFFFRIADTDRSHPATAVEPIRERLTSDWRIGEAQKLAVAVAQKAVDAINAGTSFEVAVATASPDARVFRADVGPFGGTPPEPNPLGLPTPAYKQFGMDLNEELLSSKVDLAVLDVPLANKAYIAKRLDVRGEWPSESQFGAIRESMRSQFTAVMAQPRSDANPNGAAEKDVAATWLDSKAIIERYGYKPAIESQSKE